MKNWLDRQIAATLELAIEDLRYVGQGATVPELARALNAEPNDMYLMLRRHGVKRRRRRGSRCYEYSRAGIRRLLRSRIERLQEREVRRG